MTSLKVAASVLIGASGVFYLGSPFRARASVTFAEVAERIQKAHTLAYTMTTQIVELGQSQSQRIFLKEPGRTRYESINNDQVVVIEDSTQARRVVLYPATKTAVAIDGRLPGEPKGGIPDMAGNMARGLRELATKKGRPAGERQIGNIKAQGFRVDALDGVETIVWADPASKLPVQVDHAGTMGDKKYRSTISDIALDPELDDSLFSLDPPPGYTLKKQTITPLFEKDDGSPEAAITFLLRSYAEKNGGKFPARLDDWTSYAPALKSDKDNVESAAMKMANVIARAAVLVLFNKSTLVYQPAGIKLGDADKMLLWYKPKFKGQSWSSTEGKAGVTVGFFQVADVPKGGEGKYWVLYGDLHSAEVTADKLPAQKK